MAKAVVTRRSPCLRRYGSQCRSRAPLPRHTRSQGHKCEETGHMSAEMTDAASRRWCRGQMRISSPVTVRRADRVRQGLSSHLGTVPRCRKAVQSAGHRARQRKYRDRSNADSWGRGNLRVRAEFSVPRQIARSSRALSRSSRYQGGSVLNRKSCRYGSRLASSSVALPSKRMRPSCRTMNSARASDAVSAGAIRTRPSSLTAWCVAM